MNEYNQLLIQYATLLGNFKGTLEGISCWDIPKELKDILANQIEVLGRKEVPEAKCNYIKRIGESCTLNNKCKYPNCG